MRREWSSLVLATGLLAAWGSVVAQTPASQPSTRPARITLNLEGATAEDAFDQLAKQAGVDLIVDNPSMWTQADLVFIDVKDAAFWPTFMQLCQQSRISFDQYYDQNRGNAIRLYNSGAGENRFAKLPSAQVDGFMVFAQGAQRNASVNYDHPENASSSFTVQLMVLCDPALPLQQMRQPTAVEAVDENGTSLLLTSGNRDDGYYGRGRQESLVTQVAVALAYPANGGKKIARLKGVLRGTAVTRVENIEIEDVMAMKEPLKREFGECCMTLYPTRAAGNANNTRYEFRLSLRRKDKAPGAGGIRRENRDPYDMVNGIIVTDSEGRRYTCAVNRNETIETGVEYTMQLHPRQQGTGAPRKLTWRMPAETREIRMPFEMKDLLIP